MCAFQGLFIYGFKTRRSLQCKTFLSHTPTYILVTYIQYALLTIISSHPLCTQTQTQTHRHRHRHTQAQTDRQTHLHKHNCKWNIFAVFWETILCISEQQKRTVFNIVFILQKRGKSYKGFKIKSKYKITFFRFNAANESSGWANYGTRRVTLNAEADWPSRVGL